MGTSKPLIIEVLFVFMAYCVYVIESLVDCFRPLVIAYKAFAAFFVMQSMQCTYSSLLRFLQKVSTSLSAAQEDSTTALLGHNSVNLASRDSPHFFKTPVVEPVETLSNFMCMSVEFYGKLLSKDQH